RQWRTARVAHVSRVLLPVRLGLSASGGHGLQQFYNSARSFACEKGSRSRGCARPSRTGNYRRTACVARSEAAATTDAAAGTVFPATIFGDLPERDLRLQERHRF